jgi:glycosyltransferase involved in cell wall biosynthesis
MSQAKPVFAESPIRLKVTAVIVLYRIKAWQSPAFRSVIAAREKMGIDVGEVRVLLWDNSPGPETDRELPDEVAYFADPSNSGLATAYNRAREWAGLHGSEWLLTLDQDTAVPENFFLKMAAAARVSTRHAGIGAIVPQIAAGGKQLSPNWFEFGALPRWWPSGYIGVPREPVFAFNSGAMLRLAALEQIGGYDPRFWLDNSDAMIFSKLHEYGKRVYIAGDIQVEHEFSMKDMQRRMSPERYENALFAETAFWDLRMNWAAGWERTLRLMVRLIKQWLRGDSPELREITWMALWRRFSISKRRRVEEWMEETAHRAGEEQAGVRGPTRVSVCMAAYNGGAFVEGQLKSILPQLKADDEVVIVDDGSTDETLQRIEKVGDDRIRLMRHERNSGVVATFEDAVRMATGDILFLCDDDDLWAPTKVRQFLAAFERRPDVEIVTSRVRMIDENDRPLPDSQINRGGRFIPGFWRNLYMNHYQGSAMAIRASLLGRVLPFPLHRLFLHDAWIGTRNDLLGGKVAFIDQDLLLYRRHPKNASRTERLPWQVRKRFELLLEHFRYGFGATQRSGRMLRLD